MFDLNLPPPSLEDDIFELNENSNIVTTTNENIIFDINTSLSLGTSFVCSTYDKQAKSLKPGKTSGTSSMKVISSPPNLSALHSFFVDEEEQREEFPITATQFLEICDTTDSFATTETFEDIDKLIDWCRNTGKEIGVVVIIGNSDRARSGRKPRATLICERSGQFRPAKPKEESMIVVGKKQTRNVGSKKCLCPFKLKASQRDDGRWEVVVVNGSHNHLLGENLIGHAFVGRLKPEEQLLISQLSDAGVKPRAMLNLLKQRDPNNLSTMSTIYNYRAKHRLTKLQGRSQMQQLLFSLDKSEYYEFHKENAATGECTDLLFAHKTSMHIAKCFPEVLIMDCTYKTNSHKLPLLEVVGFTSTLKTFAVCFAFLDSENEDCYYWALRILYDMLEPKASRVNVIMTDRDAALGNAIARVFPNSTHLLCRWHIEKNVTTNCKGAFETTEEFDDFQLVVADLMRSSNESEYNENLSKFKVSYRSVLDAVDYVVDLFENWKERFVSAWTDSVMHFDTHTSNRAESMHSALKTWLDTSRGDLLQNWEVIDNLLGNQITEIQATFNRSRNIIRHLHRTEIYCEIRGVIATQALDMLTKEIKKSEWISGEKMCGCVLRRTCGLPCAHELRKIVIHGKGHIPLSSIHPRWRKLDLLDVELPNGPVDITPELVALRTRSEQLSEQQNILMIKKLRELADPKTTLLQVPREKVNVRGRPSNKGKRAKEDTKRLPSGFESAQTQEEKRASANMQKKPMKKRGRPPKKDTQMVQETQPNLEMEVLAKGPGEEMQKKCYKKRGRPSKKTDPGLIYLKDVPELEHKWSPELIELDPRICHFIEMYQGVKGDGHCGYRSVAVLRGYGEMGGWERVRSELREELMAHELEYSIVFGSERVESLKLNLECRKFETMDRADWFSLPDMGSLAANAYNCVFVCLAKESVTYLPWRTPPISTNYDILTIGNIWQGQHFVPLTLERNAPLPPVLPGWENISTPIAAPWLFLIAGQLQKWDHEIPRKVNAYTKKWGKVVDLSKN